MLELTQEEITFVKELYLVCPDCKGTGIDPDSQYKYNCKKM